MHVCISTFYFSVARSTVPISNAFAGTLKIVRDTSFRQCYNVDGATRERRFLAACWIVLANGKKGRKQERACLLQQAGQVFVRID